MRNSSLSPSTALPAAGVENFIIDVGHVGFFKGLLEGSGLSAEEAEEVRGYVNAKDAINTELSLKKYNANGRALGAIFGAPVAVRRRGSFGRGGKTH